MDEIGAQDDAFARLEAALDRIAAAMPLPVAAAPEIPHDIAAPDTEEIAGRLDALIGQLRHALDEEA